MTKFALSRKVVIGFFAASLIIIVGVLALYYFVIFRIYGAPEDIAQFGESFGAASALFSAFSIAGVLAALLLQTLELGLQSRELASTKDELKRSAEAQEGQRAATTDLVRAQLFAAQLNAVAPLMQLAFEELKRCETEHRSTLDALERFRAIHKDGMESYSPTRQEEVRDEERRLAAPVRAAEVRLEEARCSLDDLRERATRFITRADELLAAGDELPSLQAALSTRGS